MEIFFICFKLISINVLIFVVVFVFFKVKLWDDYDGIYF